MKTHVRIDPELGPCTNPDMEWPSWHEEYEYPKSKRSIWLSGATVPFEEGELAEKYIYGDKSQP